MDPSRREPKLKAGTGSLFPIMKPLEVLQATLRQRVLVEIKGGRSYRGTLEGFDQHMNLVLAQAEEVGREGTTPHPGRTLVRGDSVIYISP